MYALTVVVGLMCLLAANTSIWAAAKIPIDDQVSASNASPATTISTETWNQLDQNKLQTSQLAIEKLKDKINLQSGFDFISVHTSVDDIGVTHTRTQLTYNGVAVADTIVVMRTDSNGASQGNSSVPNVYPLETTPTLTPDDAKLIVQQSLPDTYIDPEKITAFLRIKVATQRRLKEGVQDVTKATATDYEDKAIGSRLIYRAKVTLLNSNDPHQYVYEIDAHTGEILFHLDGLQRKTFNTTTTGVTNTETEKAGGLVALYFDPASDPKIEIGNGRSQYSGRVMVSTRETAKGQFLALGKSGQVQTPIGPKGKVLIDVRGLRENSDPDDIDFFEDLPVFEILNSDSEGYIWGNGQNYTVEDGLISDPIESSHGETAAIDALYGASVTWDMWENVFNHKGLDGRGLSNFRLVVHAGQGVGAFFVGEAYFPDPFLGTKQETVPETVAHELAHGLFHSIGSSGDPDTPDHLEWNYYGESGGINEANSDIMGTLVQFYESAYPAGAGSTIIPATGGNWTVAEQTYAPNPPLRYMYKPSLDGNSYNAWFPEINESSEELRIDPHYSSGPMNRMFYFLSEGVPSLENSNDYTSAYLPEGMTGIGINKAAHIWYRAITKGLPEKFPQNFTFVNMRTVCEDAAAFFHGKHSTEYKAVQDAFAAVNVGSPADHTPPKITLSFSGSRSSQTAHVTLNDESVKGGTIQMTARNAYGLEANSGYGFSGNNGRLYLGNITNHTIKIRVTAEDNDGNESKLTRWLDYQDPVIEGINCTGGQTSHGGFQHYADSRTCRVKVADNMRLNRLEFNVEGDISGVLYRYNANWDWLEESICDVIVSCDPPDWPVPVSYTFEFDADFSNIEAPGGDFYIRTTAFDATGNRTNDNGTYRAIVDEWPPEEVSIRLHGDSDKLTLGTTVIDGGSGYVNVVFRIDGESVCEGSGRADTFDPFELECVYNSSDLSNSNHTFSVTATDSWGYITVKSMSFRIDNDDIEECPEKTRFTESEPNGDGNPDSVPPCTNKVKGFWHSVSTYPLDRDNFQYQLEPGQSISFFGGQNCTFDFDTLSGVHTNDTGSVMIFNFYVQTYEGACSFNSYEFAMDVAPAMRFSSTSITELPNAPPVDVSGSALRAWISTGSRPVFTDIIKPEPISLE